MYGAIELPVFIGQINMVDTNSLCTLLWCEVICEKQIAFVIIHMHYPIEAYNFSSAWKQHKVIVGCWES